MGRTRYEPNNSDGFLGMEAPHSGVTSTNTSNFSTIPLDGSSDDMYTLAEEETTALRSRRQTSYSTSVFMTPGDIRLSILEWMYEEKDVENTELSIRNITILTELIPPFISVILYGKSDFIRRKVWRYLLDCSASSVHFSFLVVTSLKANQMDSKVSPTEMTHRKDAEEIDSLVKHNLEEMRSQLSSLKFTLGIDVDNSVHKSVVDIEHKMEATLQRLQNVKHKHIFRHIDRSEQDRTSRTNIEYLIQEVKSHVPKQKLQELNNKISFIKTLTDLDEWLRTKVPREQRQDILKKKLEILNKSLPNGSYFPVSCNSAFENHQIVSLIVEETILFNTAQKCPFLLIAEIQDIYLETNLGGAGSFGVSSPRLGLDESFEQFSNDSEKTESQDNEPGISEVGDQQEHWDHMVQRLKNSKNDGMSTSNFRLSGMFIKSGDDLRQQQLGVLLLSTFQKIFLEEKVFVKLFPYRVYATGPASGVMEPAKNTDSIARIKERMGATSLDKYFFQQFQKDTNENKFRKAQENFMRSLAGYSVVSYLIKLHDRHNGNILLDSEGHFMHIDYGFMLGNVHALERSPFKLTTDLVNILDGPQSPVFQQFRRLMETAFVAANKHHREIVLLAHIMSVGSKSACFAGGRRWVIDELKQRFCPEMSHRSLRVQVNNLIDQSMGNYTTQCYDKYQRLVNGIF